MATTTIKQRAPKPRLIGGLPTIPVIDNIKLEPVRPQLSPVYKFSTEPGWYDTLGRDRVEQLGLFSRPPGPTRIELTRQLLADYPSRGREVLCRAAAQGKADIVQTLLDGGVQSHPEHITSNKEHLLAPIHAAAHGGHLECVQHLVNLGNLQVDVLDETGSTPLMRAVWAGQVPVVRWLLGCGADPTVRHCSGVNVLEIAAGSGNVEAARMILNRKGPSPDGLEMTLKDLSLAEEKGVDRIVSPPPILTVAAESGNVDMVKLLLENGGYPMDAQNKDEASGQRRWKGSRLNDVQKQTLEDAVDKAAAKCHLDVLELLLGYLVNAEQDSNEQNVDEVDEDDEWYSPHPETEAAFIEAMFAAVEKDKTAVFELLWQATFTAVSCAPPFPSMTTTPEEEDPADDLGPDDPLDTQFGSNVSSDNLEVPPRSSGEADDFDKDEEEDITAEKATLANELAFTACRLGSFNTLSCLLTKYNADPNHLQEPHDTTPLYIAAAHNRHSAVRHLLHTSQVDIDAGNGRYANGPTALFIAIVHGHVKVVKTLLANGGPVEDFDASSVIATLSSHFSNTVAGQPGATIKLFVTATKEYRAKVRLVLEHDPDVNEVLQRSGTKFVQLDLEREDLEWLSNVRNRKPDEALACDGSGRKVRMA